MVTKRPSTRPRSNHLRETGTESSNTGLDNASWVTTVEMADGLQALSPPRTPDAVTTSDTPMETLTPASPATGEDLAAGTPDVSLDAPAAPDTALPITMDPGKPEYRPTASAPPADARGTVTELDRPSTPTGGAEADTTVVSSQLPATVSTASDMLMATARPASRKPALETRTDFVRSNSIHLANLNFCNSSFHLSKRFQCSWGFLIRLLSKKVKGLLKICLDFIVHSISKPNSVLVCLPTYQSLTN